MKIVSTTDNYLINGVQLSIGVPLDVDPSHLSEFLDLPGVVEVKPELPLKADPPAPKATPPAPDLNEKD